MITFGWGLEQGFFWNFEIACLLATSRRRFWNFVFWLANIPYVDYLPAVVLLFSTWQLSFYLLEADLPCG